MDKGIKTHTQDSRIPNLPGQFDLILMKSLKTVTDVFDAAVAVPVPSS